MIARSSGVLLPVFSLPSPGGIGTFGKAAYEFVDFLAAAGQRYWQVLPLGPTAYGDSPYQSPSAYAGNPYFVDPGLLVEDGLVTHDEINSYAPASCGAQECVDYAALYEKRLKLLRLAFERGALRDAAELDAFIEDNASWLGDYALFAAVKAQFNMRSWLEWGDEGIRFRRAEAVEKYTALLCDEVRFHSYIQYLFYKQWAALRAYAHERGVLILGDMPIYVALDSADVWARPELFMLDGNLRPTEVAGVPPDYFSKTGQLWGNPLYRWDMMAKDGFSWWRARMAGAARLFDAVRIDHFRGFASYWCVNALADTAVDGRWAKGPGIALIDALGEAAPDVDIIAEDLGLLDDGVRGLLAQSGLPGMKVLEFAFDPSGESDYLPHAIKENCVCYTGTHDNAPIEAWRGEAGADEVGFAMEYLGIEDGEKLSGALLRAGMMSRAALFVAQLQDWLGLGAESRINTPGTGEGNWRWRLMPGQLTAELASRIRRLSRIYARIPR